MAIRSAEPSFFSQIFGRGFFWRGLRGRRATTALFPLLALGSWSPGSLTPVVAVGVAALAGLSEPSDHGSRARRPLFHFRAQFYLPRSPACPFICRWGVSTRGLRLTDHSSGDEVGEEQLDTDDFYSADGVSIEMSEILFVTGEKVVGMGGDGSAKDGAVFFGRLHVEVKDQQRHHLQPLRELLIGDESLWCLGRDVSLGLGLGVNIREENGVPFQPAQKVREQTLRERSGEENVGVEEDFHLALRQRSFCPVRGFSFMRSNSSTRAAL